MHKYLVALSLSIAGLLCGCSDTNQSTVRIPNVGSSAVRPIVSPESRGTWTAKAAMPTARWDLACGVVKGILYAVGGVSRSSFLGTVEAYDPATNTWTTKASMPTARAGLAVSVINGILYAVGGSNGPNPYVILNTVEAYNPATNSWSAKAAMPTARAALVVGDA